MLENLNLNYIIMAESKGIKTNKSGLYWVTVKLVQKNPKTGGDWFKICIGVKINEDPKIFQLLSNSSIVKNEPGWEESKTKDGWFCKDYFEEDIYRFFNYNYKKR